ncbi:TetR/AcrR family transcriptional regulator [Devosia sp.]|uniref:TetR/AcrR family transcriptional regulator n=1 Tax=Devosia sp. TaxID=1871048 RepID=UPI0025FC625E|nr:TetR/AcrR family transcriptional regulator [Devosia sp.]MCR6636669.1 TetR/AcrR family transcriptional regulator [Devosia sp.]
MSDIPEKPGRGPGRPPALPPDERRQVILIAAERVFSARGYPGAAMADIARTAGMSKKTLYAAFSNKRALFEALAQDAEAFASVLEPVDDLPPLEALRKGLLSSILFALSPRQILATRILISAGGSESELASSFHGRVIARAQSRHAELLSALAKDRGNSLDDPELMAKQLFGLAMGDLHILALVGVRAADIQQQLESQIDNAISLALLWISHSRAKEPAPASLTG